MQITKLSVKDYLGITFFKVVAGKLNRITGGNGVGKTAIEKAIGEAFQSSGTDPHLIRVGADSAEILVELTNGIEIKRKITKKANTVSVKDNGKPITSPQAFLTALLGAHPFDPTKFYLAEPKKRTKLLLEALPISVDRKWLKGWVDPELVDLGAVNYTQHGLKVLQEVQETVHGKRYDVNQDVIRMTRSIEQERKEIPETFNAEEWKDFDFSSAMTELGKASADNAAHREKRNRLDAMRDHKTELLGQITQLQDQIKGLEAKLEKTQESLTELKSDGIALKGVCDTFVVPDIEAMQKKINEFQASQELVRKLQLIEEREAELEKSTEAHETLDNMYKRLTKEAPRQLLKESKLPFDDLTVDGDNIFFKNVELEKLSTSEQLNVAVTGIAKPLAGKLKVICIDRFESLEDDAKKAFIVEAKGDDFQYFITEVTSGERQVETTGEVVGEKASSEDDF